MRQEDQVIPYPSSDWHILVCTLDYILLSSRILTIPRMALKSAALPALRRCSAGLLAINKI